jgi:site-specific recombinase XerD
MSVPPLLNAAGRRRSPVTLPGYLAGRRPSNKGLRYPPDPPTVEEIVAVMRQAGDGLHGARLRALIVLLCRAGLRITEALSVTEHDLDARLGAILVRHGKGRQAPRGRHGPVGLGAPPALARAPHGDAGRSAAVRDRGSDPRPALGERAARAQLRRVAAKAGVRRRFAPYQLRHADAVELAHEGVPLNVIQRQLGHTNLGVTSLYLQGIDNAEIIASVHARKAPMIPASAGMRPQAEPR